MISTFKGGESFEQVTPDIFFSEVLGPIRLNGQLNEKVVNEKLFNFFGINKSSLIFNS